MFEYREPSLIWFMALRMRGNQPDTKYRRLAPELVRMPELLNIAHEGSEVMLFAEDNGGSGLIQAMVRVTMYCGKVVAFVKNKFYALETDAMIRSRMIEWTEGVQPPVLYTFKLCGDDETESDTIIVTGCNQIQDLEVSREEIESFDDDLRRSVDYSRRFYRLASRPVL